MCVCVYVGLVRTSVSLVGFYWFKNVELNLLTGVVYDNPRCEWKDLLWPQENISCVRVSA